MDVLKGQKPVNIYTIMHKVKITVKKLIFNALKQFSASF